MQEFDKLRLLTSHQDIMENLLDFETTFLGSLYDFNPRDTAIEFSLVSALAHLNQNLIFQIRADFEKYGVEYLEYPEDSIFNIEKELSPIQKKISEFHRSYNVDSLEIYKGYLLDLMHSTRLGRIRLAAITNRDNLIEKTNVWNQRYFYAYLVGSFFLGIAFTLKILKEH